MSLDRTVTLEKNHLDYWKGEFGKEQSKLFELLELDYALIQHVGSTAVPNIYAKPIIDIVIGYTFEPQKISIKKKLIENDYFLIEELLEMLPNRLILWKGKKEVHFFHIHLTQYKSQDWQELVCFRNLLQQFPKVAKDYSQEKQKIIINSNYSISAKDYIEKKKIIYNRFYRLMIKNIEVDRLRNLSPQLTQNEV